MTPLTRAARGRNIGRIVPRTAPALTLLVALLFACATRAAPAPRPSVVTARWPTAFFTATIWTQGRIAWTLGVYEGKSVKRPPIDIKLSGTTVIRLCTPGCKHTILGSLTVYSTTETNPELSKILKDLSSATITAGGIGCCETGVQLHKQ